MRWRALLWSIGCVVMMGCASGGGGVRVSAPVAGPVGVPDASNAGEQALQGAWELVGFETTGAARRATGQLTFDRFSNISVHAELDPSDPSAEPPRTVFLDFTAKASVLEDRGELAYVGVQRRSPPERLAPGATDPGEWRLFELSGDTLRLYAQDRAGVLTFRRVSQ